MPFDPTKPYNDLPLLPPKVELETRAVLKACIDARAALAELKQAGDQGGGHRCAPDAGNRARQRADGQVIYTPPVGERLLRDLLANWERFTHNAREIDPVVRLAVQHYQFEAIHPFIDGNGRTGRVLNLLFLVEQGLLDLPVLYLSRAILRQRAEYYRLLNAVRTDAKWEDWNLFIINAVTDTARWTTAKIRAVRDLIDKTAEQVSAKAPSLYTRELVELLFVQPYCRIGNVVDAGIAKRQTAATYLQQLVALGVLKEIKRGREKLFVNPRMLALLTRESTVATAARSTGKSTGKNG